MPDNEPVSPDPGLSDIRVVTPQADLFARDQPAMAEGPRRAWELGRMVIDFAGAMIAALGRLRDDRRLRDAVLIAILRRATITAEACYTLLARGLLEPAFSVRRTLLDLEVSLTLIHEDPTDRLVKRLAAYHYYAYQRHGQDMLSNRETREGTLTEGGRVSEIVEVSRGYARMLETDVFDDVRSEVRRSRFWHGLNGPEEAFEAVGRASDYHMTYDMATWFVHAVNIDYDFVPSDDNDLRLKPLVERDPAIIQLFLGELVISLLQMLRKYVDERGYPSTDDFGEHSTIVSADGHVEQVDPLAALMAAALAQFPHSSQGR